MIFPLRKIILKKTSHFLAKNSINLMIPKLVIKLEFYLNQREVT